VVKLLQPHIQNKQNPKTSRRGPSTPPTTSGRASDLRVVMRPLGRTGPRFQAPTVCESAICAGSRSLGSITERAAPLLVEVSTNAGFGHIIDGRVLAGRELAHSGTSGGSGNGSLPIGP